MPQIKKAFTEVRIPFTKMTFTPDVPSSALGPNEYNAGENVETDVRGIRSVLGEGNILEEVPGTPIFIAGGFRTNALDPTHTWYFIIANEEGQWWANNGDGSGWTNITPVDPDFDGTDYAQTTNITEGWNGTVPIFNDGLNAPFFWPDATDLEPNPVMTLYTNLIAPATIFDSVYDTASTFKLILGFTSTGSSITGSTLTVGTLVDGDIYPGMVITGTGVIDGTTVVANLTGSGSGSTWSLNTTYATPVASTAINSEPYASAPYTVGKQILITNVNTVFNGIYTVVSSTTTTITYTAQPAGTYPLGFQGTVSSAYTWNYNPNWKKLTAGFVRLYSTPNVGNILVAGNLTSTDLDDVVTNYPVTVAWSQAFGQNQAPLSWQPTLLNVANQLEVPLRGTLLDAFPANGNLYLTSYWDTVVFTPMNYSTTSAPILGVRLFNQGRGLLTANCWANTDNVVYGLDARDIWMFDGQNFNGIGNQRVKHWFFDQLDPGQWDHVYMITNTEKNQIEIYYPTKDAVNGVPNKMLSYRYDIDCWNAPRDVLIATYACETPVWSQDPDTLEWSYNPASRTVAYAKGALTTPIIQKDKGYYFVKIDGDPRPIVSSFRRDNLKLAQDYSTKTLVHRVLPEFVNLNNNNVEIDPVDNPELVGKVNFTVEGANSVGQTPQYVVSQALSTDTNYPWIQINQNAHRVNSLEISSDVIDSAGTIWMCNSMTFQYAEIEDDR